MLQRQSAFAAMAIALSVVSGIAATPDRWISALGFAAKAGELKAGFSTITSDELAEKLANKDFFLVNVHIPYEGEIEQTDIFLPFDKIADNLDNLPSDQDTSIILYCRSGRMSEIAAAELAERGFTRVAHLSGGMVDWAKSGREVLMSTAIDRR